MLEPHHPRHRLPGLRRERRPPPGGPWLAACALLLALGLPLSPVRGAGPLPLPASEPQAAARPALEAALLSATNAARKAHGLGALQQDEGLARAAREHAAEMARLGYFAHSSPVARHAALQDRLALAGCPYVDIAENIAMLGRHAGPEATARQTVQDWLDSPPHRRNLLDGHYDRVGFGTAVDADGRLFLVQDFAANPLRLESASAVVAARQVYDVRVTLHASRATQALLQLGSDTRLARTLPPGTTTVTLTTPAAGTVALRVGEASQGSGYLIDDGGRVALGGSGYHADPEGPYGRLRIVSVTVRARQQRGARLTLDYASPAQGTLALFLKGAYRPEARRGAGSFELFLPSSLGPATVSVGVEGRGGTASIVQRFHLDAAAALPVLRAGAAP